MQVVLVRYELLKILNYSNVRSFHAASVTANEPMLIGKTHTNIALYPNVGFPSTLIQQIRQYLG